MTAAKDESQITTVTALAASIGRSKQAVSKWTKREDWPFSRKPPWDRSALPKIRHWAQYNLKQDGTPAPASEPLDSLETPAPTDRQDERAAKLKVLDERGRILELQRKREEGQLLAVEDVRNEWSSICALIRTGIQNLTPQLLPMALSLGMPRDAAGDFRERCDALINSTLRLLSRDADKPDSPSVDPDDATAGIDASGPAGGVDADRLGGELPRPVG